MIDANVDEETVPNACSYQRCFYPQNKLYVRMVSMLADKAWRSLHPDLWHLVQLPYNVPAPTCDVSSDHVLIDPATHAYLQFKPPEALKENKGFITHIVLKTHTFVPDVPDWLFHLT